MSSSKDTIEGNRILKLSFIVLMSFMMCSFYAKAEKGSISGVVLDPDGSGVPFVMVQVDSSYKTLSDIDGAFKIDSIPYGDHQLVVAQSGYQTLVKQVTVNAKSIKLDLKLEEVVNTLAGVVIETKSLKEQKKEEPYAVTVIDAEPLKAQNRDVNQILNTTTGVRIREAGGLGSNFSFSLNGFTGNQVKFFLNGIPMDNFGTSLSLNNYPVNLISRIEIYKGVVPIHLGADALGGAVNIVTNEKMKSFADVSYSYGSFNTHRASLMSRFVSDSTGFVVNANAFFNYSYNNYKVLVEVPDKITGKYGDPEEVERFHDGYQSQMVQLEAGLIDKKFADELFIGAVVSSNQNEIQTGTSINKVVGAAFTKDKVFIPSIRYKKSKIFNTGLSASFYANYNTREALAVDSTNRVYDWYGDYEVRPGTSGELNWDKTLFRFKDRSALVNANLSYDINNHHTISINNVYSHTNRVGEDPISYNAVPFSEPNTLQKNVTGLAYSFKAFDKKWNTTVFAKNFYMKGETFIGDGIGDDAVLEKVNPDFQSQGYGLATTYFIIKNTQLKASYENTYRLPTAREMFGDGLLLLSNPNLEPEQSENFNLGLLTKHKYKKHELLLELGYLYRLPQDLIMEVVKGRLSYYENLSDVVSNVFEGGVKYAYNQRLTFTANASYQDIVNNDKTTPTGGENFLFGDRIPNTPYLFGNVSAGIRFKNVGFNKSALVFNWYTHFVEEFFLKWPSQGYLDSKSIIPRQLSHDLAVSYSLNNGMYNVSFACTNLLNDMLFDNYKLQKPGRAFSIKLNYFWS